MADTYFIDTMNCYCTQYKLRGFDIYKFHDKGLTTCWEVWWPNGGPRALQADFYKHVQEFCKEHQHEIKKVK